MSKSKEPPRTMPIHLCMSLLAPSRQIRPPFAGHFLAPHLCSCYKAIRLPSFDSGLCHFRFGRARATSIRAWQRTGAASGYRWIADRDLVSFASPIQGAHSLPLARRKELAVSSSAIASTLGYTTVDPVVACRTLCGSTQRATAAFCTRYTPNPAAADDRLCALLLVQTARWFPVLITGDSARIGTSPAYGCGIRCFGMVKSIFAHREAAAIFLQGGVTSSEPSVAAYSARKKAGSPVCGLPGMTADSTGKAWRPRHGQTHSPGKRLASTLKNDGDQR